MYRPLVLVFFLQCFILVTANIFPILEEISSDCQNDLRMYRSNTSSVHGINTKLFLNETCLNSTSFTKGNKYEAICPSIEMINERDSCNNYTGEFCRINIESSSSNKNFSVDFSFFLCLPRSCARNSSDMKLLANFSVSPNLLTYLSLPKIEFQLHDHKSSFSFDAPNSACSLYNNSEKIAEGQCQAQIKCGGMSTGLIILTVLLVFATILSGVLVAVMFYQKRKAAEEYSGVPNTDAEYS